MHENKPKSITEIANRAISLIEQVENYNDLLSKGQKLSSEEKAVIKETLQKITYDISVALLYLKQGQIEDSIKMLDKVEQTLTFSTSLKKKEMIEVDKASYALRRVTKKVSFSL